MKFFLSIFSLLFLISMTNKTFAGPIFKDNFQDPAQWTYISDNVMGGVSTGSVAYKTDNGAPMALLSGNVTTENNGGFIQVRRNISNIDLKTAKFVKVVAKGNNQKYFIH